MNPVLADCYAVSIHLSSIENQLYKLTNFYFFDFDFVMADAIKSGGSSTLSEIAQNFGMCNAETLQYVEINYP